MVLVWFINNEMIELFQFIYRKNVIIHSKASTLQFQKVSKCFTRFSVSGQGRQALRLQETKLGVKQLHDSRVS